MFARVVISHATYACKLDINPAIKMANRSDCVNVEFLVFNVQLLKEA